MLSTPFPSWINRWANVFFLIAILSPVALLYFIKQPVYEQTPFMAKGNLLLANISNEAAQLNAVGDKVQLKLANRSVPGYIRAITPGTDKRSYTAQVYCSQLNDQNSNGSVSFKKNKVSIIEKIFD